MSAERPELGLLLAGAKRASELIGASFILPLLQLEKIVQRMNLGELVPCAELGAKSSEMDH